MEHKRTTAELIELVGQWAVKNFEYRHGSHWGMMEELGEAARGVLKHIQGIRGFDVESVFEAHMKDSFADVMIYLCDFCFRRGAFFTFNRNQLSPTLTPNTPEELIATHALQCIATMMNHVTCEEGVATLQQPQRRPVYVNTAVAQVQIYNLVAQRMCTIMEMWAQFYGWNLEEITWAAWDSIVSKRDWKKNRESGLPDPPVGMKWVPRADRSGEFQLERL